MYGWRARLGIVTPSSNIVTEPEFELITPTGVSCHYQRFAFTGGGVAALKNLERLVPDAAELISHVRPSAVAMCCTGGSFAGGLGHDQMLIRKMKERNGNVPTTTTSTAMIEAFKTLGIKKVSLAVPYLEEVALSEKKFIEDHGIRVLNIKWLNLQDSIEIAGVPREVVYSLANEVNDSETEAVFLSCIALHTIGVIEILESDLQKPVISSNQATMWHLLKLARINEKIEGYGQLLSKYQ
jgi:maleate cis-trans isomerase